MKIIYTLIFSVFLCFTLAAQNTIAYTNLLGVCENDTLFFNDNSTLAGGATVVEYAWDFDGDMVYDLITTADTAYFVYTSAFIASVAGQRTFNTSLRVVTSLSDTLYSDQKAITVHFLPVVFTSGISAFDSSVCKLDTVFFFNNFYVAQGTINNTYWYFNDNDETYTQNYFSRIFETAAEYNVKTIAYSDKGCKTTVFNNLTVHEIPSGTIEYSGSTTFYDDASIDLTVNGVFDTLVWNTGATTPVITVNTSGTYAAALTNKEGCSVALTSEEIHVIEKQPFETMNLLTLNDDGKNDIWKIYDIEAYGTIEVVIYNRNGVLVYENMDYKNTWNGTNNTGSKLAEGAYYYTVKASELKDVKRGVITIVH